VLNSYQHIDRWLSICHVRIVSLVVDDGAYTLPLSTLNLRPKRMLVYGDSIGEGVYTLGIDSWDDLEANDATVTWVQTMGAAMQAEVSVVCFGRQGYTIEGMGNVPPLLTPGNASLTAWNKFDIQHSRLFRGYFVPTPNYIFCGHGTNDGLQNAPVANVTASALAWLYAVRQAAPSASIFLAVPFGSFMFDAIEPAFYEYQETTMDSAVYFVDLGVPAQHGVLGDGQATAESFDGLHPRAWRSSQLGGMLVANIVEQLANANA